MTNRILILHILSACSFLCPSAWAQPALPENPIVIRGTYGNPDPFWKDGHLLDEYGINAIFVHHRSITSLLMERAQAEGCRVFAEFATLNGKGYVEEHPDAWPVNASGRQEPPASWFMGVCPTNADFRQFRLAQLRELLEQYAVAGVWLDYLHWHAQFEEPEPILPETCFCDGCLATFQQDTRIVIPPGDTRTRAGWILKQQDNAWRDWRCSVVTEWIKLCRDLINEVRPGVLLGIYHCPWTDDEFDGARRRTLGLDFESLAAVADVFSPMVYHGRMGRPVSWVQEYITWFCNRLKISRDSRVRVWPIVQARSDPQHGITVTPEDFEMALRHGVSAGADGVMMFTFPSLVEEPAKLEVMRRVYQEWRRPDN